MKHVLSLIGKHSVHQTNPGLMHVSVERERFAAVATDLVHVAHLPLSLLYATDNRTQSGTFGVHALFSIDDTHEWLLISCSLPESDPTYESLTKTVMVAHSYERYAMDMFGIVAVGHPDPRRLIHHENIPLGTHPLRKDFAWNTRLAHADVPYPMHHIDGEGVYEIPVGPIHAGIIEPGHFRFNVMGERILTLEGKLFFTHKGVEKLMEGKTLLQALPFVERLSGDAAAAHAITFSEAVESIAECAVPAGAQALRAVLCELERITMHIHDIGNIIGMGTGSTVAAAHGFRIKERMMRLSERITGNRFWRGMILPGGCSRLLSRAECDDIRTVMQGAVDEIRSLTDMAFRSDALRERLETTGLLSHEAGLAYGALGVAARASGIQRDVRRDHPSGAYRTQTIPVVSKTQGDVYARLLVRCEELPVSVNLIRSLLPAVCEGEAAGKCAPKSGMGLGAVELWRGECLHVICLVDGVIDRAVLRDPSFCNWALFGEIGPGNIVPDFPLCNKSLNLSYSGTDL